MLIALGVVLGLVIGGLANRLVSEAYEIQRWSPAVELATAAGFGLVAWGYQDDGALVLVPWLLIAPLVALSVIDLQIYRLPNRIVFPTLLASAVVMAALVLVGSAPSSALV